MKERPILICYGGSEDARRAVAAAADLLARRETIVFEVPPPLTAEEVRRIVGAAHTDVLALLQNNHQRLDSLARALLAHETLDEEEAYAAAGIRSIGQEAAAAA
jgi:hypothetical protein